MSTPANPDWSNIPSDHNLAKFAAELPAIVKDVEYDEIYGVKLQASEEGKTTPYTTLIILQKFLRANANDLAGAKTQLTNALRWRKEYQPLKAVDEVFSSKKFGGLGYVTTIKEALETNNQVDVATFNIYGVAAKDPKTTFGDTEAFVRWRVALMEITLAQLKLNEAVNPIPDYAPGSKDPYQAIQIHDYLSVSFFRQPAEIKAASQKVIKIFSDNYPETVSYKYFVNVPMVMQWMMGAMKALISKDAFQKMTWLSYGNTLHTYLGDDIPPAYGGKGAPLTEKALTPKYDNASGNPKVDPVKNTGEEAPRGADPAAKTSPEGPKEVGPATTSSQEA